MKRELLEDAVESVCRVTVAHEELLAPEHWHMADSDRLAEWEHAAEEVLELADAETQNTEVFVRAFAEAIEGRSLSGPVESAFRGVGDSIDRLLYHMALLEVLCVAAEAAAALRDPTGERADTYLKELGVLSKSPCHREALFKVMGDFLKNPVHKAWTEPEAKDPAPFDVRLRMPLIQEAKRAQDMYGSDKELGTEDLDRLEVDRRAARRREKGTDRRRQVRIGFDDLEGHAGGRRYGGGVGSVVPLDADLGALSLVAELRALTKSDEEHRYLHLLLRGIGAADARREAGLSESSAQALHKRAKRNIPTG